MSEPYTPTTEELRILYVSSEIECPGGATHDADDARANAEFDRWMLERDRQVAERAWDEGQTAGLLRADFEYGAIGYQHVKGNPYTKGEQK